MYTYSKCCCQHWHIQPCWRVHIGTCVCQCSVSVAQHMCLNHLSLNPYVDPTSLCTTQWPRSALKQVVQTIFDPARLLNRAGSTNWTTSLVVSQYTSKLHVEPNSFDQASLVQQETSKRKRGSNIVWPGTLVESCRVNTYLNHFSRGFKNIQASYTWNQTVLTRQALFTKRQAR